MRRSRIVQLAVAGLSLLATLAAAPHASAAQPATDAAMDGLFCARVKDPVRQAATDALPTFPEDPSCTVEAGASWACAPAAAAIDGAPLPAQPGAEAPLVFDRLCYRVHCPQPSSGSAVHASDAMGDHSFDAEEVKTVCTPALLSDPGDPAGAWKGAASAGAASVTAALPPAITCGDATEDGKLTSSDALAILRTAVGTKTCLICVCDVDASGKILAADALRSLRHAVGQDVPLTCQADGNPISWDGGGDGTSWTDPLNWSLDRIPNSCDDATVNAGVTVVHATGSNGVRSLTGSAPFDLNGGTLTLRSTVEMSGLFRLHGATLAGASVVPPGNAAPFVLTSSGGTLNHATVSATLDASATSAYSYVTEGLTLDGLAKFGSNAGLFFQGSGEQQLSGNGSVNFLGGGTLYNVAGSTLRIGSGIDVHGPGGNVGGNQAASHLIVDGTVAIDESGTTLVGSADTWTNNGTLSCSNSGTLALQGPWTNLGTLQVGSNGTLALGGTFASDGIGTISRSGGTINLTGQMTNTGKTFTLDAQTGDVRFVNGKIIGGTVDSADGAKIVFTSSGGTLVGVNLAAGADLTATSAYTYVQNGLTLGGSSTLGANAGFFFQGSGEQMLTGDGEILFNGASAQVYNYGGTLLHIGADIFIHGPGGTVGGNQGGSTMTIDGTVNSDAPGTIYVGSGSAWTNNGTIGASNGGTLILQGPWTNAGTLTLSGASTLDLGGTFASDGIGTISRSGGTINLTGQVANGGKTMTLTAATGDFRLINGKVTGGTIASTGGAKFVLTSSGGTLDGVTVSADMDGSATSAYTYIQNGLTLNHDAAFGPNSGLFFQGSGEQNLSGTATITLAGANAQVYNYGGTLLHIGSGITVRGGGGNVGGNQGGSLMTIDGVVKSDTGGTQFVGSGGAWTNKGTVTAKDSSAVTLTGPWTNQGTFTVDSTSTFNLGGTFSSSGVGTISRSGGTINLTGQMANASSTFTLNSTTGDWRLLNGKITGGTIASSGGKLVLTSSGGTLDGVNLSAGVDGSATSAYTYIDNGLVLGGSTTFGPNAGFFFRGSGEQMLTGTGTILLSGSNAQVYNYGGTTLHLTSGITIHGSGGIVGGNQGGAHLTNEATVTCDASGELLVGTGDTWSTTGSLNATGGNLRTRGTWSNAGSIHLGAGRSLFADSGFAQGSGGTTTIDIGGSAASSVGKIVVTGAASLGGTLTIALTNAYVPNLGDTFTILTSGSTSGTFATASGLDIAPGKKFSVTVGATSVTLTVVAA